MEIFFLHRDVYPIHSGLGDYSCFPTPVQDAILLVEDLRIPFFWDDTNTTQDTIIPGKMTAESGELIQYEVYLSTTEHGGKIIVGVSFV